jgi:hypothetical protein
VHPIVFDSITGPIHTDWLAKRREPAGRFAFWGFRRARNLPSFIPISTDHQVAMVRGFITARLLGHLPDLVEPWTEKPLAVWSPGGPQGFPPYLFREVTQQQDLLPALLEALPLAFMSFGSGVAEELAAYERLIELGRDVSGSVAEYAGPNPELAAWIATGEPSKPNPRFPAAPKPDSAVAGSKSMSAEERGAVIVAKLTEFQDYWVTHIAPLAVTRETTPTLDPRWEIHQLYLEAVSDMLGGLASAGGATPPPPKGG